MRHGKTFNHLGRTSSHRKALLKNMANSLILHKRIETTVAKAKELRKYVEPLLTKSKTDSISNRRLIFAYLRDKEVIKTLFGEVSDKIANRPGGYTRIIKLGARLGDNAEMALIELVDFNETYTTTSTEAVTKTRRSRKGGSGKGVEAGAAAPVQEEVEVVKAPEVSDIVDEISVAEAAVAPEVEAVAEEVVAEAEVATETSSEVEASTDSETSVAPDEETATEDSDEEKKDKE